MLKAIVLCSDIHKHLKFNLICHIYTVMSQPHLFVPKRPSFFSCKFLFDHPKHLVLSLFSVGCTGLWVHPVWPATCELLATLSPSLAL